MAIAKKGDWVQIENVVLPAGQRAPAVPDDTQACDLKLWVKGIAQHDGKVGEDMEIITATGRKTSGKLVEVNPKYVHSYGEFQPELLQVEMQLKEIMYGGEK